MEMWINSYVYMPHLESSPVNLTTVVCFPWAVLLVE